jgi:hypothetical protein
MEAARKAGTSGEQTAGDMTLKDALAAIENSDSDAKE